MINRLFRRNESEKALARPLPPGTTAPNFSLPSTSDGTIGLADLEGRPAVLVFYPADASPVCSNQLALYNQALHLFQEHQAQIVGISADNLASHQAFAQSLGLDFPLLADDHPPGGVARAYGVFDEQDGVSERALFVLDTDGVVRWSYVSPRNVNPGADGILRALESLAAGA